MQQWIQLQTGHRWLRLITEPQLLISPRCCIRNIVFRASLNLDSDFPRDAAPFATRDAPGSRVYLPLESHSTPHGRFQFAIK